MTCQYDLVVVGAGAAGLAAAIFAAEVGPKLKIVVLDGAKSVGAKILVSGGGRCNVTNATVMANDFHAPARLVQRVLKQFDEQDTVTWFNSLNVPLKQEPTGKVFPVNNNARSVLNGLLHRCHKLGIHIETRQRVQNVRTNNQEFLIETQTGLMKTRHVIMATGGKSLPKSGSDGSGWDIVRQLGHTVTSCYPALVPLVLQDNFFHKTLSGISHEATITTSVNNTVLDRRSGSLLWTHFGVSGPVVMDASRFWVKAHAEGKDPNLSLLFFPDLGFTEVERWLLPTPGRPCSKTLVSHLSSRLPQRVATALCDLMAGKLQDNPAIPAGPNLARSPVNQLSRQTRRTLSHVLTDLPLPVIGSRGWNYAEVTAGGIPLSEINVSTMESRLYQGLYLIGEMLNCDGRIGGFNFQWAWSTGYIAGRHVASKIGA